MRHQPALVDRIARETAAEVIVDAASAHVVERQFDQVEKAVLPSPQPGAPEVFQHRGLRKLRRTAQAAVRLVDHAAKLRSPVIETSKPDRYRSLGACAS